MLKTLFGSELPVCALPAIIPCPICARKEPAGVKTLDRPTMTVTDDPDGGYAWHCYRCERTWDSIELIADVRHRADIPAAIAEIRQSFAFDVPSAAFTEARVNQYMTALVHPRRAAMAWNDDGVRNWTKHSDGYAMAASLIGGKVGVLEAESSIVRRMGRWVRGTSVKHINAMLNNMMPCGLDKRGYSAAVAVPWYRLQGRMSAIFVVGYNGKFTLWHPEYNETKDTGIMLIDAVPRRAKRVFATSSPWMAVWLQHRHATETDTAAPVVGWHHQTNPDDWRHLEADRIVFWSYDLTPAVLRQALSVPNSSIKILSEAARFEVAWHDASIETPATWERLRKIIDKPKSTVQIIEELQYASSDPWNALHHYLSTRSLDQIAGALGALNLTGAEIDKLLALCKTDNERQAMLTRLDQTFKLREIVHDGKGVREIVGPKECKWVLRRRGSLDELITDAVLRLDTIVEDKSVRPAARYYGGLVHYKGKSYPLMAESDALRSKTAQHIRECVETNAGELPYVSQAHSWRMWDLACLFSTGVRRRTAVTRVGWNDNLSAFMFPNLAVGTSGMETVQPATATTEALPCHRVRICDPPSKMLCERWLEPTDFNAVQWAVMAAVVNNMIGPLWHRPHRGIAVIGESGHDAVRRLASDMGLISFSVAEIRSQFKRFDAAQRGHDVPVALFAADTDKVDALARLSSWISSLEPKNVVATMRSAQAASALLYDDWVLIDTQDQREPDSKAARAGLDALITHFLSEGRPELVANDARTSSVHATLSAMIKWASATAERSGVFVENTARSMIHDAIRYSMAHRFVRLLGQMCHDGYLRMGSAERVAHRQQRFILVDAKNDCVRVDKERVYRVIEHRKLPTIDYAAVTAALLNDDAIAEEHSEQWAIRRAYWNTCVGDLAPTRKQELKYDKNA